MVSEISIKKKDGQPATVQNKTNMQSAYVVLFTRIKETSLGLNVCLPASETLKYVPSRDEYFIHQLPNVRNSVLATFYLPRVLLRCAKKLFGKRPRWLSLWRSEITEMFLKQKKEIINKNWNLEQMTSSPNQENKRNKTKKLNFESLTNKGSGRPVVSQCVETRSGEFEGNKKAAFLIRDAVLVIPFDWLQHQFPRFIFNLLYFSGWMDRGVLSSRKVWRMEEQ